MLKSQIFLAVMATLLITESFAAMIGDIRVNSALGEKFDASVSVASTDDEEINNNCFRLVSPHDGEEQSVLRRAKLIFQQDGNGGRLLIHGLDASVEPVVNVSVRVKCPGQEDRVFQRDYSVLLDPREYKVGQTRKTVELPIISKSSKRSLPRLGSAWLTEEGDTVANVAKRYYPTDEKRRAKLIEGIFDLNPDLPQGTSARLGGDWRLQLPSSIAETPAAAPATVRIAPMSQSEVEPHLTLDKTPSMPAIAPSATDGLGADFRLRLSQSSLDLTRKNNLSPQETLRLRERLLSLESDEQASQMLQLKYQIAQLEKQLNNIRSGDTDAAAASSNIEASNNGGINGISWKWLYLVALLLIVAALLFWRQRAKQRRAEEEPYSMLGISTMHAGSPYGEVTSDRANTNFNNQLTSRTGGFDRDEVGIPVRNMEENEWLNEDMDVVSPSSVAEEVQLLIDHGLINQAINLLLHEVAERPTSLALWMKSFDVFQQNNMVDLFQERAVAFRLQFSSEALWQQVQALGVQIDPTNPLYQSADAMPEFNLFAEPETESSAEIITDQNLAQALYDDIGLNVPQIEEPLDVLINNGMDFEVDFSLLDDETIDESIFDESTFDESINEAIIASIPESYSLEEHPQDFVAATPVAEKLVIDHPLEPSDAIPIDAADFASDDETLQQIAKLITDGQRREAFDHLEILLYKGTMPQRLIASKWLDKLLSKYGKP